MKQWRIVPAYEESCRRKMNDSRVRPVYEGDYVVAVAWPGPTGTDKDAQANARLIAAAPDLLAALHAFNDAYSFISENAPAPLQHAVRKARAAIARAKGDA